MGGIIMHRIQGNFRILIALAFAGLAGCENKFEFSRDNAGILLDQSSGLDVVLEGGRPATHNQVLQVEVRVASSRVRKMRIAESSQFSASLAWRDVSAHTTVDLGAEWAEGGKKDNVKTIVAEFKGEFDDLVTRVERRILLDTVPPRATALGLLATGVPSGSVHRLGDRVSLEWDAKDVPSPATGNSAGLDPSQAVRIGWTRKETCDAASLISIAEWGPNQNGFPGFSWPISSPAENFFVCVIVQDAALNQFTLLSQPMTSLWQVLAGDNNPGNGGSATARNVRFNYPGTIAVDSSGNAYVYDRRFRQLRKITKDGYIGLVAGNGQIGNTVAGDATATPLAYASDLAIDSKNRLYLVNSGTIWRLVPSDDANRPATLEKWAAGLGGTVSLAIDRATDALYVSRYTDHTTVESGAYLYRASIPEIDSAYPSAATRPSLGYFQGRAIAGNGKGLPSSDPYTQTLAATEAIDYPFALAIGDQGELYYATTQDGNGYGIGHHQVRVLRKDAAGILRNSLVANSVSWVQQIQFIHLKGTNRRYLLVGTLTTGLRRIELGGTLPVAAASIATLKPYPTGGTYRLLTVAGVAPVVDSEGTLRSILASNSDQSQVVRIAADDAMIVAYGRPVYDAGDAVATEAMVNNPHGIAQAKNGDVYFFETLSHIVRKVDAGGAISLLAGSPGEPASNPVSATVSFKDARFDGLSSSTAGYPFMMVYNDEADALLLGDGSTGYIRQISLAKKTVSVYSPALSPTSARSADPVTADGWPVFSLAINPPGSGPKSVYAFRSWRIVPFGSAIRRYAEGSASALVAGTGAIGAVRAGAALATDLPTATSASAMDGQRNYYFSASGGTFRIDPAGNLSKVSAEIFSTFAIFEEADGSKHLVGVKSDGATLAHMDLAGNGSAKSENLCLPGTFLNTAKQVIGAADGNLLIADTFNSRVLKYYLRDGDRNLRLTKDCP